MSSAGTEAQHGMEQVDANALRLRIELQADCLAGVWANRAQAKWQFIEPGDVETALQTDAFTHGTSAERTRWFKTGLQSGEVADCLEIF
jgi:uncharacterized protein